MKLEIHRGPLLIGLIGAAAGALAASSALALPEAQPDSSAASQPTAGALTVMAPRVLRLHNEAGPAWAQGAPIEVVSLQKTVKFGDLDLTTQDGVTAFKSRIMYASLDACNELEAEYPSTRYLLVPATQNCPDTTATAALAVAKEIIAAARSHAK